MLRPSGVSSASDASCAVSARSRIIRSVNRDQIDGLPVAERDRAGLVEQEDIHVARCFDCPARGRDHVAADKPVHPGNADGAEQAADGGRCKADKQGDKDSDRDRDAGTCGLNAVDRERPERCTDYEKYCSQPDKEDVERNLVRCLLPLCPFDETDHVVEEPLARRWRSPG